MAVDLAALLDDPGLLELIDPEWEEEWHGHTERRGVPRAELDENAAFLADLVGVPYRRPDGTRATLRERSDLAHATLAAAAKARLGP